MALCADVPLSNYSLTHPPPHMTIYDVSNEM